MCTFYSTFFFDAFTHLVRFNANVVEMHLFFKSVIPIKSYDRLNKSRVPDASTIELAELGASSRNAPEALVTLRPTQSSK